MVGSPGPMMIRGFGDFSLTRQRIRPGTVKRILPYAKPYRWGLAFLSLVTALDAAITVAVPLLLAVIIDNGILHHRIKLVVGLALLVAGLAMADALLVFGQNWYSSRVSQGLIFDLRTKVFRHIQRQPLAFFTRAQTGSLVSRLNTDVVAAQQAVTTLLSSVVSSLLSFVFVLVALFLLSWLVAVIALAMIPLFVIPTRLIGRRLQRLTRESMQLNAELGSTMNERFNVAGAMLTKLYGRAEEEVSIFAGTAGRVRDIGVLTSIYGRALFVLLTMLTALTTALAYGLGGSLVIWGTIQIGTLVALAALLTRLYGPITQLSNVQVNVMTALVSFDRVFELLDLKPLISERPGAVPLSPNRTGGGSAPDIEFEQVCFRYPAAREVSLASLESIALPAPERPDAAEGVLNEVSFVAPGGRLTALVGLSGAGKTTITHLVSRLYDPTSGVVRLGGHDLRDLTLDSLHDAVGVVTQDAHLFHQTIRSNLLYARPDAAEQDLIEACQAAQIWDLISALPDGLDTVVGDRGYRLSGGEKQRVALARLLLKAPSVVVLDEATAHLDSESEAAIQAALRTALAGRTSLVIAHRLSTVREASQILVVDGGKITERGTHAELLEAGGLYAELYRTQFAKQALGRAPGQPADRHDDDDTGMTPAGLRAPDRMARGSRGPAPAGHPVPWGPMEPGHLGPPPDGGPGYFGRSPG